MFFESIKKVLSGVRSYSILVVFTFYATGFIIWNKFLSTYGFFEYNLIQMRYLSAGIAFWLPILFLMILGVYFFNELNGKSSSMYSLLAVLIILSLLWVFVSLSLFKKVPQYFGGAKPIPTTIIGTPDQVKFLSNFSIESQENAAGREKVQTVPVCLIYQNDDFAIISNAKPDGQKITLRFLSIPRSQFIGFHTTLGPLSEIQCDIATSDLNI